MAASLTNFDCVAPVPKSFLCPILQDIMVEPVATVDGHVYEKSAIELWLVRSDKSPMTNLVLHSRILTPNLALKKAIDEYLRERPVIERKLRDQQSLEEAVRILEEDRAAGQMKIVSGSKKAGALAAAYLFDDARVDACRSCDHVALIVNVPRVGPQKYKKLVAVLEKLFHSSSLFMPVDTVSAMTFGMALVACSTQKELDSVLDWDDRLFGKNYRIQVMQRREIMPFVVSDKSPIAVAEGIAHARVQIDDFLTHQIECSPTLISCAEKGDFAHSDYRLCRTILERRFLPTANAKGGIVRENFVDSPGDQTALHILAMEDGTKAAKDRAQSLGIALLCHPDFTEANHQDVKGFTALHYAMESRQYSLCKALLTSSKFEKANAKTQAGDTALTYGLRQLRFRQLDGLTQQLHLHDEELELFQIVLLLGEGVFPPEDILQAMRPEILKQASFDHPQKIDVSRSEESSEELPCASSSSASGGITQINLVEDRGMAKREGRRRRQRAAHKARHDRRSEYRRIRREEGAGQ